MDSVPSSGGVSVIIVRKFALYPVKTTRGSYRFAASSSKDNTSDPIKTPLHHLYLSLIMRIETSPNDNKHGTLGTCLLFSIYTSHNRTKTRPSTRLSSTINHQYVETSFFNINLNLGDMESESHTMQYSKHLAH